MDSVFGDKCVVPQILSIAVGMNYDSVADANMYDHFHQAAACR